MLSKQDVDLAKDDTVTARQVRDTAQQALITATESNDDVDSKTIEELRAAYEEADTAFRKALRHQIGLEQELYPSNG